MRKRVIKPTVDDATAGQEWLDLEQVARVEVTSEDADHPIEGALVAGDEGGWRAAEPGEQAIRLVFDQPQRLSRIWLRFVEPNTAHTHEFALRWSPNGGRSFSEIVRQQWNFAPPDTTQEIEDYRVDLSGVTVLELAIRPGRGARASLAAWRLGA